MQTSFFLRYHFTLGEVMTNPPRTKAFGESGEFREGGMGLSLVPVSDRGYDVICQFSVFWCPSQGLNRYPQILLKIDWILDMPPVKAPKLRRLVIFVG